MDRVCEQISSLNSLFPDKRDSSDIFYVTITCAASEAKTANVLSFSDQLNRMIISVMST